MEKEVALARRRGKGISVKPEINKIVSGDKHC
jgi:hypothetical protein